MWHTIGKRAVHHRHQKCSFRMVFLRMDMRGARQQSVEGPDMGSQVHVGNRKELAVAKPKRGVEAHLVRQRKMKGGCSITCVGRTLDLILTNSMNELACNGKRKVSPLLQVHSEENSGDVVGHRSRRSKLDVATHSSKFEGGVQ